MGDVAWAASALGKRWLNLVHRLRCRIFRQDVQIERRQAGACQAKDVQHDGKGASKMCAKPLGVI